MEWEVVPWVLESAEVAGFALGSEMEWVAGAELVWASALVVVLEFGLR